MQGVRVIDKHFLQLVFVHILQVIAVKIGVLGRVCLYRLMR